jgi:hypothetical protein
MSLHLPVADTRVIGYRPQAAYSPPPSLIAGTISQPYNFQGYELPEESGVPAGPALMQTGSHRHWAHKSKAPEHPVASDTLTTALDDGSNDSRECDE